MNIFLDFYNSILYYPIFNFLIFLYQAIPFKDFGLTIIVMTVLVKLVLLPLEFKALKSQKAFKRLQSVLDEIQKKYKDNKEEQGKALMEAYQKEGINPFSSIGMLFVQLPILIAIYQAFNLFSGIFRGENPVLPPVYSFVRFPESINFNFLGMIDLSRPFIWFAVLVGILQAILVFSSNKGLPKAVKPEEAMQRNMNYFFIGFIVLVLLKVPSALGLYFIVSLGLTVIQQYFVNKQYGTSQ